MKHTLALALALAVAGPAHAQAIVGVGSNSESTAVSGSSSTSGAVSDQQQGQSQGLQNSNANTTTAQQGNQQATSLNFEASTIPTSTTVNWKGNTTVALAAGVSFSADYCGGTASGGASAAGVSIGGSKPIFDGNCQALRRAEKFGVAAANAYNMGQMDWSVKLLAMQIWETCNAGNTSVVSSTAEACKILGLTIPNEVMAHSQAAHEHMPQRIAVAERATEPKAVIRDARGSSVEVDAAKVK